MLSVPANTTPNTRTGTFTLMAGNNITRVIQVTQPPAPLFWHADSNNVGFWPGAINVSAQVHGSSTGNVTRNFTSMVNNASAEWSTALGVPINRVSNLSQANVRSFGGQRPYMNRLSLQLRPNNQPPNSAGWAFYATNTQVSTINVGGVTRSVRRFSNYSPNFNVCTPGIGIRQSQTLITHEMGHSIGFWGHAPNTTDIMFWQLQPEATNRNGVLSVNESRHVRQIYDRFR